MVFEKGEVSLWVCMKNCVLIFWLLIIYFLERIDMVLNVMDLRGFGKKDKCIWFYISKVKCEDFIVLFVGIFIFIVVVYLKLNVF